MSRNQTQAGDQYLNSRELMKRKDELESELIDRFNEQKESDEEDIYKPNGAFEMWVNQHRPDDDEAIEYLDLVKLEQQGQGYGDWDHGETLILEEYFQGHIEEIIKDTVEIPEHLEAYIDFEAMAKDYKVDYHEVEFGGYTYYMRA